MNFRDMDSTDFAKAMTTAKKSEPSPYAKFHFRLCGYQLYFKDKKIDRATAFWCKGCQDASRILEGKYNLITAKLK